MFIELDASHGVGVNPSVTDPSRRVFGYFDPDSRPQNALVVATGVVQEPQMTIEPPFEIGRVFPKLLQVALGKNREPFARVRDRLGYRCRHPTRRNDKGQPQAPFVRDHFQLPVSQMLRQLNVSQPKTASLHVGGQLTK